MINTRLSNYPITRFQVLPAYPILGSASTNVDALIKLVAPDFRALVSSTIVALNSFQTSGNSPGDLRLGLPVGCRFSILGYGTVGPAIPRRLAGPGSPPSLQLTHICGRRARETGARQPEAFAGGLVWTDTFDHLVVGGA